METTTYGYRKPEAGDKAKNAGGWFESLEFNIDRLDAHNHDGVNSPQLSLSAFAPYTVSVPAASWVFDSALAAYKQTITVPVGVTEIDNYNVKFRFTAPAGKVGEIAYLNYDRLSATTFEVYCNDNTAAFTAYLR